MQTLELPHTLGCLVCGRDNALGLRLSLFVDPDTGIVTTEYTPQVQHIGFQGIVHGGVIATVMDEAMVWAATWAGKRFCLCGELTTRFRRSAELGRRTIFEAKVEFRAPRLIQTAATMRDEANQLLATASGKYVPISPDQHAAFMATMVDEPTTTTATNLLRTAR
jgi:acyl-coenzyme A thioesterase PaaI-like protein